MSVNERWLPIAGYEGIYEVSARGGVRSLDRIGPTGRKVPGRTLRPTVNASGYPAVVLYRDGAARKLYVHRIVLSAFVGPCPEGMEALHGPSGQGDPALSNLRWGTHAENVADTIADGNHNQARKTRCIRNHLLVDPNLTTSAARTGRRGCLACNRAQGRARSRGEQIDRAEADQLYAEIMKGTPAC
ncbi:NUMOD4 motif-containing HNH endonuclease [uncultured Microbacterium sp.]|uniref:NUMOD4 motif-containing HNH endonuclease n=1 Tax=uncultured Microbacterium sp. TaxID=191216 RepID=UPI003417C623